MNGVTPDWVSAGTGLPPHLGWSFRTSKALVCLALARETGEVFIGDAAGGISQLDRTGQIISLASGFRQLRSLAWCDKGDSGVAILGDSQVVRLNRAMEVEWSVHLPDTALDIAIDPYGDHMAVSLASRTTLLMNRRKKRLCSIETTHPLRHLKMLLLEPGLVGAAEHGQLCRHEISGERVWSERFMSTVGDLDTSASGDTILLAARNIGIQRYDGQGRHRASHIVEGTVERIAVSVDVDRFAAATLERQLYWLGTDGEPLWTTETEEDVRGLACDPFGEWIVVGFESGLIVRLDWNPIEASSRC